MTKIKILPISSIDAKLKKLKLSYTVNGNAEWRNHFGIV